MTLPETKVEQREDTSIQEVRFRNLDWFLEHFDDRVRSRRQLEEITGYDIIGKLPKTRSLGENGNVAKAFACGALLREDFLDVVSAERDHPAQSFANPFTGHKSSLPLMNPLALPRGKRTMQILRGQTFQATLLTCRRDS